MDISLDDAVTGLSAGETATFTSELVGGAAKGTAAEVQVTVVKVQTETLPEVDDEFAQLISEFDTVEEMRAELVEHITSSKLNYMRQMAQTKVLEALVERTGVIVPESVVELEVDSRINDLGRQLSMQGIDVGGYLDATGETLESLRERFRPDAEQARAADFALTAYAAEADISVSDTDLDRLVAVLAAQAGKHPKQMQKELERSGRLEALEEAGPRSFRGWC